MIRPFSLRDWALLHRLSDQGTLLHTESALTRSCQPLRGALFNMVVRGDAATYVWRGQKGEEAGFVQILIPAGQPYAHLLCLGTTPAGAEDKSAALNETAWLYLLDGAVAAVGRRGIHSVIAEVTETGPELPLLRRGGFAVYTRQDIWVNGEIDLEMAAEVALHPATEADSWDVEWLYAHTVPPLIQLVEPLPPQEGQLWTLREDGELVAFVHLHDGPAATWLRLFIHPNAQVRSEEIVAAATALVQPKKNHPLYCCVRRYQSWLDRAMGESGYTLCQSQAVMVRHIAKAVKHKNAELSKLLPRAVHPTTLLQEYGEVQHCR